MKKLLLLIWMLTLLLSISCNVQKREIGRLDGYSIKYPAEFARLSNMLNPCFTGKAKSDTVTNTVVTQLPGDTSISTVLKHDSVFISKTINLPGKTITSTVTVHDTIPDNRALNSVNGQFKIKADSLVISKTLLSDKSKAKNTWMWIALSACSLILIFLGVKTYLFFSGGAILGTVKKLI